MKSLTRGRKWKSMGEGRGEPKRRGNGGVCYGDEGKVDCGAKEK